MNGLSLICLALVAVTSVYSLPKIDTDDLSMQQLMAKMKEQIPDEDSEEATALLNKVQSVLDNLDFDLKDLKDLSAESEEEIGEIGPNFSSKKFFAMIKRVTHASWQKRCKKVSGDDNAYSKAVAAREEFGTCFENWSGLEEIMTTGNHTAETGEYIPLLKAVCNGRSGFFACTDKYISSVAGCYFPKEMAFVHKVDRINKNLLDLVCSNDENNFAIFSVEGDGLKCVQSSFAEIKTCANKAVFSVTERLLEKWIENEHFNCGMETEDCQIYDAVKSCFVSSVENCTNPKVKNIVESVFQIVRDETKC